MSLSWMMIAGHLCAQAAPFRGPVLVESGVVRENRLADVAMVKLAEGLAVRVASGRLVSERPMASLDALDLDVLNRDLAGAVVSARFTRGPEQLRAAREAVDPEHRLADLSLYFRVETPDAALRVESLRANPLVENAYLAHAPVEPPTDIPPTTPDLLGEQGYWEAGPDGFGFSQVGAWPGWDGGRVAIGDVEYGWDPNHEDLGLTIDAVTSGWASGYYAYHGNGVLGEIFGEDNGYGILGMSPGAEPLVIFPYDSRHRYDIADAVDRASELLVAGDVLLIEQQAFLMGNYCPVEQDQAVFDVISLAVAQGIVVVEPGGNGAQDLDNAQWGGIFDRSQRDSGAILVGGGASPVSGELPRSWYPQGSSYGSRVDVQGWYDGIATAATAEYGANYADLFFPNGDTLQAYTSQFGGTSGASPLVTSVAAILESASLELYGLPLDPLDVRTMMVTTGTPGPEGETHVIGPQPDLRRLTRTYFAP